MQIFKNIYLHLVVTFGLLCLTSFTIRDDDGKRNFLYSGLPGEYIGSLPDEKYIINTDRDIFFINENIWFTVWSIDDVTHIPVTRSRVVYFELIGQDSIPVSQQALIIKNNLASGKLLIPATLRSGIYYLRAYTNWQKNFGAERFGVKIIQIINPYSPPNIHAKSSKISFSCFPEGGRLVYGVKNKVLVEAKSDNGRFEGFTDLYLADEAGELITNITNLARGIGFFFLTPQKGKSYFLSDTTGVSIPLEIQDEGLFIGLSAEPEFLEVLINGKLDVNDITYYFIAKNSGQVFFEKEIKASSLPEIIRFPADNIPDGLSDFSILKANEELISQRLYFKLPEKSPLAVDIVMEKQGFHPRDSVVLEILSPDYDKISVLSISIRKKVLQLPSLMPDLQADILLNSNINDWDIYKQLEFNMVDSRSNDILNTYLISKSLSRNRWAEIATLKEKKFNFPPEINKRYISGIATDPVLQRPLTGNKLLMYFVSRIPYLLMANTDEEGRFIFSEPLKNYGKQEILLQAVKSTGALSVEFDWPYYEEYYPYKMNTFYFDSLAVKEMDEAYVNWQINMLHREYIESNFTKELQDEKLSLYGYPDLRFYLDDYIQFTDMMEVFKEIIERVRVDKRNDKYFVYVYDSRTNRRLGVNPLVLFNGHVIDNLATIFTMPVQKIHFIDVITDKFYLGETKYDGVVNIVPKDVMIKADVPVNSYRYIIDLSGEKYNFGTPDYSIDKKTPFPDFRNTVYWNPDVKLEGAASKVSFFSGDNKEVFELELKAIGTGGEIIQLKKNIEIF